MCYVARREENINAYLVLVGEPECRRPLIRPRRRCRPVLRNGKSASWTEFGEKWRAVVYTAINFCVP